MFSNFKPESKEVSDNLTLLSYSTPATSQLSYRLPLSLMSTSSPRFWPPDSEVTLLLDFWVNGKTMTWLDTLLLLEVWPTTSPLLSPSTTSLMTPFTPSSRLSSCSQVAPSSLESGSIFPAPHLEMSLDNSLRTI